MKESKKALILPNPHKRYGELRISGLYSPALLGTDYKSPHLIIELVTNMTDQNAIELPSELKGKKFRIRKLTPRECFRLMGVDDKNIDKIQAAGVSNSGQYKLAGNSIVAGTGEKDSKGNYNGVLFNIFRTLFIETEQQKKNGTQLSLF